MYYNHHMMIANTYFLLDVGYYFVCLDLLTWTGRC